MLPAHPFPRIKEESFRQKQDYQRGSNRPLDLGNSSDDETDSSVNSQDNVACHPAAFSEILPSMEAEIDCSPYGNDK